MEYPEYIIKSESNACMLCSGNPCGKACPYGINAAGILKARRTDG